MKNMNAVQLAKFPYEVVGNRYKADGSIHKTPWPMGGFKLELHAVAFADQLKREMPSHGIRVIRKYGNQ